MNCPSCASQMKTGRETYRYTESGLPSITLEQVDVHRCSSCGESEVDIPRIEELHRVIAHALVQRPGRLNGQEIRYLRKYLGFSGADFASAITSTPETVSRWENNKKPISHIHDLALRMMVLFGNPTDEYPPQQLTAQTAALARRLGHLVKAASPPAPEPLVRVRRKNHHWASEHCAVA